MPMIRITNLPDGAVIYEGEGELVMGPDCSGSPSRVALRQEDRRGEYVRSRQIDLSSLLEPSARAQYRAVHEPFSPTIGIDPSGDAWAFSIPAPVQNWELRAEFPPGMGDWLRRALEAPLETPDECRAREEARHDAMVEEWREAVRLEPSPVSYRDLVCQAFGIDPSLVQSAEEAQIDLSTALGRMAEATERASQGLGSLAEAFQRNEEAITSARAEFPHDPYDYGRIYPGNQGTSRWTPPEDPDEKIRSCP